MENNIITTILNTISVTIQFPETNSNLEFTLRKPLKSMDSPFGHFTTSQSEDLIFGYFEHEILRSLGIVLVEVVYFQL